MLSLVQHQKAKNPVVRALTGTYVHLTIEKLGIGRALSDIKVLIICLSFNPIFYYLKDMTDKILIFSSASYQDPSADVRFWGKKIILLLSPHHGNTYFI